MEGCSVWRVTAWGTIGALYVLLAFFSLSFASRIVTGYLTTGPSEWQTLPGLGEVWLPAFGMYVHWIGGAFILMAGLVQLFPFTRRKAFMPLHRALGTAYIAAAIAASVGGNIFIYTHGCVGGTNMDIAFSVAGWVMFGLACCTYYHARKGNKVQHRDFAIRLWGQGIASLMYRMYYMLLGVLFSYSVHGWEDFHRPLDEVLDWWFFVPNLLVTEAIVHMIHRRDDRITAQQEEAALHGGLQAQLEAQEPLLLEGDEGPGTPQHDE